MALGDILNAAQIGHDPLRARMQGRFSNGKNEIAIPLIGNHPEDRECYYCYLLMRINSHLIFNSK